jgi:hypothetical protein
LGLLFSRQFLIALSQEIKSQEINWGDRVVFKPPRPIKQLFLIDSNPFPAVSMSVELNLHAKFCKEMLL